MINALTMDKFCSKLFVPYFSFREKMTRSIKGKHIIPLCKKYITPYFKEPARTFQRKFMHLQRKLFTLLQLISCNNYIWNNLAICGDIESNPGPIDNLLTPNVPVLSEQRLQLFQLKPFDVGGEGDCFFRAVSHQLCGDLGYHLDIRAAGVAYMRDNPE